MKMTVMGSLQCPDTVSVVERLDVLNAEYEFVDITGQLDGLKRFLNARDGNPLFSGALGKGIGIPYFRFDNGFETLDTDEALKYLNQD